MQGKEPGWDLWNGSSCKSSDRVRSEVEAARENELDQFTSRIHCWMWCGWWMGCITEKEYDFYLTESCLNFKFGYNIIYLTVWVLRCGTISTLFLLHFSYFKWCLTASNPVNVPELSGLYWKLICTNHIHGFGSSVTSYVWFSGFEPLFSPLLSK